MVGAAGLHLQRLYELLVPLHASSLFVPDAFNSMLYINYLIMADWIVYPHFKQVFDVTWRHLRGVRHLNTVGLMLLARMGHLRLFLMVLGFA